MAANAAAPEDDPDSDRIHAQGGQSLAAAFDEFERLETYGPAQYEWLVGQIKQVARLNGFPPRQGSAWTDEVAQDWLHEQLSGTRGVEFIMRAVAGAADAVSYRLIARRTIKNAFIDEARATPAGRMRMRMNGLLSKEPGFVNATRAYAGTHAWTIGGIEGVWDGEYGYLLRAPGLREVGSIQKLNAAGPTSADNRAKLIGAARLMITHANGAVTAQALATALVRLFEIDELEPYGFDDIDADPTAEQDFLEVDQDVDRGLGWDEAREYVAPVQWIAAQAEADLLLNGLTREEKIAIGLADHPAETLGELLPAVDNPEALSAAAIDRFRRRCATTTPSAEGRAIAITRCSNEIDA